MGAPDASRGHLRRTMLALRGDQSSAKRAEWSAQIQARLCGLPQVQQSHAFFVYCGYRSEVATDALLALLLAQGHVVTVPLTDAATSTMQAVRIASPATELIPRYKGILEPDPSLLPARLYSPTNIDVALIPGVVFDRRGFRLGYGGGYYDRFLSGAAPQALRIGLAYSLQVVERLQEMGHDIPMDMLVTENEVLSWPRNAVRG